MRRILGLLSLLCVFALAARPQTAPSQTVRMNVSSVQGFAPGYKATAGSGFTLNLASGTAFCAGTIQNYSGGTLTMSASATNYVYLDPSANCAPAVNTTGFSLTAIPVAIVVSNASGITNVTDARTMFASSGQAGAGTGACGQNQFVTAINSGASPTCGQAVNSGTAPAHQYATGISAGGALAYAQPSFSDVSGTAAVAQLPLATAASPGILQLAGDLGGSAATPAVVALQGQPVASTAPATNQVLTFNGRSWTPATPPAGAGTGACPSNQFVNAVNSGASPTCAQAVNAGTAPAQQYATGISANGSLTYAQPSFSDLSGAATPAQLPGATGAAQGAVQLSGDFGGSATAPRVAGLQGNPVAGNAPAANQVLTWNGSQWAPAAPSGGGGSGLPSSWTVDSTTNAVTAQPTSGQDVVPFTIAPNVASPTADLFDVFLDQGLKTKALSITSSGNLDFMGNDLSLGTSGQSAPSYLQVYGGGGNQPYVQLQSSDGSKNAYLSLSNSTNGVACISSSAPAGDCAAGTQLPLLAQDLGGTATAPTVVGLQGNPVSNTAPAANQVLTWNGSAWAPATPSGGGGGGGTGVGTLFVANPNSGPNPGSTALVSMSGQIRGGEANSQSPMPTACTARNLFVWITGAQSSTGSLVITFRKAGASTALAVTIAAGASKGVYSDTTDTVALSAGDLVNYQVTDNATTGADPLTTISLECN
jgi:Repeat of unknown function (DUF5907)